MQGDQVGSEYSVNTTTNGDQISPSVALNTTGESVVVWDSWRSDWGGYAVCLQLFASNGAKVRSETLVLDAVSDDQRNPSVSINATGVCLIVWQTSWDYQPVSSSYNHGIRIAKYYPASGTIVPIYTEIKDDPDEYDPAVSMSSHSGDYVAVWTELDQDGSGEGIYGMGSGLGSAHTPINTYTSGNQNSPSVAVAMDGSFVVVWRSEGQDGDSGGIYGQRFQSDGSRSGLEFGVNSYVIGDQAQPSVAMDSGCNFVVVWSSFGQDGNGWGIYGQRFSSTGVKLGSEFRVNSYTYDSQYQPSISASSSGEFVVVWSSIGQDGSGHAIIGQRYYNDGTPLGGEFMINSYTNGDQKSPCVSLNGAGDFVIVWQSENQDGSGWGIFGQLYDRAPISEFPTIIIPVACVVACFVVLRRAGHQ